MFYVAKKRFYSRWSARLPFPLFRPHSPAYRLNDGVTKSQSKNMSGKTTFSPRKSEKTVYKSHYQLCFGVQKKNATDCVFPRRPRRWLFFFCFVCVFFRSLLFCPLFLFMCIYTIYIWYSLNTGRTNTYVRQSLVFDFHFVYFLLFWSRARLNCTFRLAAH